MSLIPSAPFPIAPASLVPVEISVTPAVKVAAATAWMMSPTSMSEQLFEPSDCKTCIFNNSTHRDRVHRIVMEW